MKILIRKSDNVVLYAQDDLILDTEAHGIGWRDPHFNTGNATIVEATLPDNWTGAVWSYTNGVWAVADPVAYAAIAADVQARVDAAKSAIHASIKAERDRRKFNGVYASNKWMHTDTYSRTQWMGMVMMGASVPTIQWTTMDNTTIATSQALANAVFQATATLDTTLFDHAKSLIAAVDASNDPASVDITAGWPATFEGVA